jgi:hypothetical protein
LHLFFLRTPPELTIQILTRAGFSSSCKKTARIAQRIEVKFEVPSYFRDFIQFTNKVHQAQDAGGFISVNTGENPDFMAFFNYLGALEPETRQPKCFPKTFPNRERISTQAMGMQRLRVQRRE